MAETRSTVQTFAPHVPVSVPVRAVSFVRAAFVQFVTDNPLTWFWNQGRRNAQADMEGPLYVIGAPDRNIEPGKAVLATPEELKEYGPYVLTLTIRTPDGAPVPNTHIDFWQATTKGVYYYSSYNLRGKFTTDAQGRVEILTIAPGAYGPTNTVLRAGHFHLWIDGGEKFDPLTTQLYVCPGNQKDGMLQDFLNYVRKPRFGNLLQSWSIAAANDGKAFKDFPELKPEDDMDKRVEWWNARIAERAGEDAPKVLAGAQIDILLNKRTGWLGF